MTRSTGIIKRVDSIGRIAIPKTLRKLLDIDNEYKVAICLEKNVIRIKRYEGSCVFCGKTGKMKMFRQKYVCSECLNNIPII